MMSWTTMASRWLRLLFGLTPLAAIATAGTVAIVLAESSQAPVRGILSLPVPTLENLGPIELAVAGLPPHEHLYARNLGLVTHLDLASGAKQTFELQGIPNAIAGSPTGDLLALDATGRIQVYSPEGLSRAVIHVGTKPRALAMFGDGTIILAGISAGRLLHVFDSNGTWRRSFGELETEDQAPNVLHSLVTDGTTAYLIRRGLEPTVRRFSANGEVLSAFSIETDAVALQRRMSSSRGGLTTILGAAFDLTHERLVLGFAGSSDMPTLEEFSPTGEHAVSHVVLRRDRGPVSSVDSVAISSGAVFLAVTGAIYQLPRSGAVAMR